jgi:hypothetical protein
VIDSSSTGFVVFPVAFMILEMLVVSNWKEPPADSSHQETMNRNSYSFNSEKSLMRVSVLACVTVNLQMSHNFFQQTDLMRSGLIKIKLNREVIIRYFCSCIDRSKCDSLKPVALVVDTDGFQAWG